jgi:hypothetical protein
LSERHRHRIHQVRATGLHDVAQLCCSLVDRRRKVIERRQQAFGQRARDRQLDRRRNDVVAALTEVDMVVRMHGASDRA